MLTSTPFSEQLRSSRLRSLRARSVSGFNPPVAGCRMPDVVCRLSTGVDGSVYSYPSNVEAGALSESFADIFGMMVEYYTTGSTDYIVGSNLLDYFKRSLQNPRAYQHYSFTPYNDNNCVYQLSNLTASTVPLYWNDLIGFMAMVDLILTTQYRIIGFIYLQTEVINLELLSVVLV